MSWGVVMGMIWAAPGLGGLLLILAGILIILEPRLLAYVVGAAFVMAGLSLLTVAFSMRSRVTIRRLDPRDGP